MSKKIQNYLSVGEVANRSGVAVSALHFYEAKGLIDSTRNAGNQRRYHRSVLRRVAIIKVAQELGFSLREIGHAMEVLPQNQIATKNHWQKMSQSMQNDLNDRIEKLVKLRDQLTSCIGCGCLSLKSCPLYNPDDKLGNNKQGAQLL